MQPNVIPIELNTWEAALTQTCDGDDRVRNFYVVSFTFLVKAMNTYILCEQDLCKLILMMQICVKMC